MNDKKPLVSSEDYGKDEDTAETLIKKHEVIEKDIIGMYVCVLLFVCTESTITLMCVCTYVHVYSFKSRYWSNHH